MLELQIFSVRDTKGDRYNNPFVEPNIEVAQRTTQRLVMDPQTVLAQFPEDFDLYHLGSLDTISGKITAFDTPRHVIKAANLLSRT